MATEHDSVDTGALATLVVVGVFAILGVALGVDALYRNEVSKVGSERADGASHEVDELVTGQRAALDAQPLPIDRAMSAVVLDLQRNPWSATPPMPDKDAGADAAAEGEDAGADAAVELDASGQPIEPAPAVEQPREHGGPPNDPTPPQPTQAWTGAPLAARAAPSATAKAPTPPGPTSTAPAAAAPTAMAPKAPTAAVAPKPSAPPVPAAPAPTVAKPPAPAPAPPTP
jgi:hypothetical protein